MDADGWRKILITKKFSTTSTDLCETITEVINKLCTTDNLSSSLHSFLGCHLIPLEKNSGLRPIGIREILCASASKVNMSQIWKDLTSSVCSFQVCAGHEAGCKSILCAMHKVCEEDESETTLLVDASNAFN